MPTVRLRSAAEYPAATQKLFELSRAWFNHDFAHDPAYAAEVWAAARHAFADNRLARRFKEALVFAVSVTTRSASGAGFHLAEMRRLGVSQPGVMEIVGVTPLCGSVPRGAR